MSETKVNFMNVPAFIFHCISYGHIILSPSCPGNSGPNGHLGCIQEKFSKKISKNFFSKIREFPIISELALNPANSHDGALEHFKNLNTLGHLSILVCRTDHQREAAAAIMDQTLRLMF